MLEQQQAFQSLGTGAFEKGAPVNQSAPATLAAADRVASASSRAAGSPPSMAASFAELLASQDLSPAVRSRATDVAGLFAAAQGHRGLQGALEVAEAEP